MRIIGWVLSVLISTPVFFAAGWLFYGGWNRFFDAMGTSTAYRRRVRWRMPEADDTADAWTCVKFDLFYALWLCVVFAVHWLGRAYWPR